MIFPIIDKSQSAAFELVKFLMLFWIILGHTVALTLPKFSNLNLSNVDDLFTGIIKVIFGFGREFAIIFVFLSGFFTAQSISRITNSKESVVAVCARLNRLLPFLWLGLLFTMCLDWIGSSAFDMSVYETNGMAYKVQEHYRTAIVAGNFFGLQPTVVDTLGSNGPLWTLGYLIQFYILMALIKKYIPNEQKKSLIWLTIIASATAILFGYEFMYFFAIWLFGTYSRYIQIVDRRSKKYVAMLVGVAFTLVCAARPMPPEYSFFTSSLAGFVILLLCKQSFFADQVARRSTYSGLFRLGFAAYSIHMPIVFFLTGLTLKFFGAAHLNSIQFVFFTIVFILTLWITSSIFEKATNSISEQGWLRIG